MDPNAALLELRKKFDEAKAIIDNEDRDSGDLLTLEDITNRVIDVFDGLDEWLKNGGALPTEWERQSTAS